jgi:acetyl esterase/lipase
MASPGLRLHSHTSVVALILLLFGLPPGSCTFPADPRPQALVAADRRDHLLDRPFPSEELRSSDGRVRLEGYPLVGPAVGQLFMSGWLRQVETSVNGFSAMTPIFFRIEEDPELNGWHASLPWDAVRLISLDSDHRVPVRVDYLSDALGDPYLRDGLLVVTPDERVPLRPGERYACLVARRAVRPAPDWAPPEALPRWLAHGAGVATVFTIQDSVAELASLRTAADAVLASDPSLPGPGSGLREVASLGYQQGATPSGNPATVEIVRFRDGGEEITFLGDIPGAAPMETDLIGGPMRVFQATIPTIAFQDPEGRPYQSSGLGILGDTGRGDGWILFGAEGELLASGQPEPMRVVVQVPREAAPRRVVVWGHGSGGDAYAAVQRKNPDNDMPEIRRRLADLGAVLVSSDQPLFGRRFPLIDRGYETNMAVVNVPNLPAFRAAMQQGAVDQHLLIRFVREQLPDALAEVGEGSGLDPLRLGVFGHSIGAQISGVAAALHQDGGPRRILINGTSAFQTHSVLASDLFQLTGIAEMIFQLAGVPVPDEPTPPRVLGALFGVPAEAWNRIDRFHPLGIPFQLVIDGGDPLPVASSHPIPTVVFQGDGDSKLPEDGPGWLADATRDGELVRCTPSADYDGHFCIFREETGFAAFEGLAEGL